MIHPLAVFSSIIFLLFFSLGPTNALSSSGTIPFRYKGETFQTWTEVFNGGVGAIKNRPLLVLHGGPGLSHDYLLPIQDLSSSRTVIFYDQVGVARSSRADAKPQSFWTVDLFLAELQNVIAHFGIGGNLDILGHSWGGMLAAEYAVTNPKGLKSLVLSDSLPEMSLWDQSQGELVAQFPECVQRGLANGLQNETEYRLALGLFFGVHGCTLNPWPQDLNSSFEFMFADPTVNVAMSETLQNWTIVDRLSRIEVPTLVINGAADIAQDFVIQPFLDNIVGSTHVKFQNSSHTPMWEERAAYMKIVGGFLG